MTAQPHKALSAVEPIERLLARNFARFKEWSLILTRGDRPLAEEIVQELMLHLLVARPDLSRVADLDAYLYISLRNMYRSRLMKNMRENGRSLPIEDYDAFGQVLGRPVSDLVEVQNQLLQISAQMARRKYETKSASCFLLHFFWGYTWADVARLARLPISAVYNKLHEARTEIHAALRLRSGRSCFMHDGAELLKVALPSDEFLLRLRRNVAHAEVNRCPDEEELLRPYQAAHGPAIGCEELAHLAACEPCQSRLARALGLKESDGPFDGLNGGGGSGRDEFARTMRAVAVMQRNLLERRPAQIVIAIDGRQVAAHTVCGVQSALSARMDSSTKYEFVEVFNEYGERLAHLALNAEEGAPRNHQLIQEVVLSDGRWLRLDVCFDGLGMEAEAVYVDDAYESVAPVWTEAQSSSSLRTRVLEWFKPRHAWAMACAMGIGVVLLLLLWVQKPSVDQVLSRAQAVADKPGMREDLYEVMEIVETTGPRPGTVLAEVEVWQSADGRRAEKLFDRAHHRAASRIQRQDGADQVDVNITLPMEADERLVAESGVWQNAWTTAAIAHADHGSVTLESDRGGYVVAERSRQGDVDVERRYVVDRAYHLREERARLQGRAGVVEVSFHRRTVRRVASGDVPADAFELEQRGAAMSTAPLPDALQRGGGLRSSADAAVKALYALFEEDADTRLPIEVMSDGRGHVRVYGTVGDSAVLQRLRSRLATLPESSAIEVQLHSAADAAFAAPRSSAPQQWIEEANSEPLALPLIRQMLQRRGLKGTALVAEERQVSASTMGYAQTALEHAYALDRLSRLLASSAQPLSPEARACWLRMTESHAQQSVKAFEQLRVRFNELGVAPAQVVADAVNVPQSPAALSASASQLLRRAQRLHERVVELFAGAAPATTPETAQMAASRALQEAATGIPQADALSLQSFATRLATQEASSRTLAGRVRIP